MADDHESLWLCFQTGQMSEADLLERMAEDRAFAVYVKAQAAKSQKARNE